MNIPTKCAKLILNATARRRLDPVDRAEDDSASPRARRPAAIAWVMAISPRRSARGETSRNRPFIDRDDVGRLYPLPVVRLSAGRSFATDSCSRLTEDESPFGVELALPPASSGEADYGTSLRASTSLIRRLPPRLHESNRISRQVSASFTPAAPRSNPRRGVTLYHEPVLAMLVQGSAGASASPACSSSREMPSGVRIKAMRPSRGGRLIVTPWATKAWQVS